MATQMSRREFLVKAASLAGAAAGGAVLAACGPTPTPEVVEKVVEKTVEVEKLITPTPAPAVKLTGWHGSNPVWDPYFLTIAPNMAYAGITPKVEIDWPPISWRELFDKYWLATEAGLGPDVMYSHSTMVARGSKSKAFLTVPESAVPYSWIEDTFIPQALEAVKLEGKYYYVPWEMSTMSCQCNLTMLEEVGYDHMPTSFEEFVEMAQACVKRENGKLVRSGFGHNGPAWFYREILQNLGGEHFTSFFQQEITWNNELGWEAWELYADLERKYDIMHNKWAKALGWYELGWASGVMAFQYGTASQNTELETNVQGAKGATASGRVLQPDIRRPGGYVMGTGPNWGLQVLASCPEEKRDAAWKVFKHCLSKEALLSYFNYTTYPPTHKEILAMGGEALTGPRAEDIAVELADLECCGKVVALPPDTQGWQAAHEAIYEKILGGMSPKDAMAEGMPDLLNAMKVD